MWNTSSFWLSCSKGKKNEKKDAMYYLGQSTKIIAIEAATDIKEKKKKNPMKMMSIFEYPYNAHRNVMFLHFCYKN